MTAWRRIFLILLRERIVGAIEPKSDGTFAYHFRSGFHESAVSVKLESISWTNPALGRETLSEAGVRFHALQVPPDLPLHSLLDLATQIEEARLPEKSKLMMET